MLKIVKDSVLKVSRSFGYDIVPLREMKERDFALHLRELLARLEIDCVLDVGANVGQYRDFLRDRVLYDGPIVSFEPVGRHVEMLRERSRGRPQLAHRGLCAGQPRAGRCRSTSWCRTSSARSSSPTTTRVSDYARPQCRRAHKEMVAVRTLDGVLPGLRERLGFDRPYLKIDTQGFDIEVLRGGGRQPAGDRRCRPRLRCIGIYKGMPGYMETIRYLDERGFDITGLYPVSRDNAPAPGRVRLRHDQPSRIWRSRARPRTSERLAKLGNVVCRRRTCWAASARGARGSSS